MIDALILLVFLAPVATFLALALPIFRWTPAMAGRIGVVGPTVSFFCSVATAAVFWRSFSTTSVRHVGLWTWVSTPAGAVPFALHIDALALVMMLVVSGVGALIHVYSLGYMAGDREFRRYFAYMNLFIFMMLLLVMADSLPLLFFGWEGVGLCSYLLIGFWFQRPAAARAGRKAFVVTRIGDAGFLAGLFLAGVLAGTWSWEGLQQWVAASPPGSMWLNLIGAALLLGALGKSAQIPLYVWLPDAMEGPTPVSALIHAATMVTAGVYLITRMHFLYEQAPAVRETVAWIGVITALYAAMVALAQTEMKRILAFSTISQIGYMFLGVGIGAYVAAIFHLVTHAFFKALLFLGTGNVMHALDGEQEIWRLGRLQRFLPVTSRWFLVGALTLAGIPPLAAFFSKEALLSAAYAHRILLWGIAWFTAGITAFYALRLYLVPFRGPGAPPTRPHEAPSVMLGPVTVLAGLSILGGMLGLPGRWNLMDRVLTVWAPTEEAAHPGGMVLVLASITVVLLGVGAALLVYDRQWERWRGRLARLEPLRQRLARQLGWNEAYDRLLVRPLFWIADKGVQQGMETRVIDGVIDGSAHTLARWGERLRDLHSGNLKRYAFVILLGLLSLLVFLLWRTPPGGA